VLNEAEQVIPISKRLVAESVGTFGLVFTSMGSSIADALGNHVIGSFAVAVAPGLLIMAMIYALDKVSGAYFNPAISIGFTLTKHLRPRDLPLYILAQLVASIAAALAVYASIGRDGNAGLTIPLGSGVWYQAFILELILTFFLMLVGVAMKEEKGQTGYKSFGGIAIGGTIIFDDIVGMQISGASMNPARSFGPALVSGNLTDNWIYWLAPILGAIIAVTIFRMMEDQLFYRKK
jgi:MIP family channel proteins